MDIEQIKELLLFAKQNHIRNIKYDGLEATFDERAWSKQFDEKPFILPEEQKKEEENLNKELMFWSA